ncbi:MAG: FAD-binding oxidoreductase [Thaumarchaeota archaeon]|nr:FAD-binding oxidoreductase [Nitrososphaerota archaeon]
MNTEELRTPLGEKWLTTMDNDLLVVGAGIMGVASAYHLKKNNPNKDVLLIDRFPSPAQGNTGRSNAMFRNTFSSRDNQILSDASIDFYLHLQNELEIDIGLQPIGYLWLMSDGQLSASEPFLKQMERNRIEIRRLPREEVKRLLPGLEMSFESNDEAMLMDLPRIDGGVFGPKCGRLDPDKLVRFYAQEFSQMGGRVAFNTNAEKLLVGPSKRLGLDGEPFVWQDSRIEGVQVSGSMTGELRAETIVLACGAWGNELLEPIGIDGHVKAKKRQLFTVPAKGSDRLEALVRTEGFNPLGLLPLVILPKARVHFKPVSTENEFWIACEDEVNRPYIDIPAHDLEGYKAEMDFYDTSVRPVLSAYFPDFRNARVKAMWAGLYSYNTLDFLPFAFRENNLIVVGGDSGSGIMKGDSLGRIVDALYRGEDDALLYGDRPVRTSKIGFEKRDVEREEWVI